MPASSGASTWSGISSGERSSPTTRGKIEHLSWCSIPLPRNRNSERHGLETRNQSRYLERTAPNRNRGHHSLTEYRTGAYSGVHDAVCYCGARYARDGLRSVRRGVQRIGIVDLLISLTRPCNRSGCFARPLEGTELANCRVGVDTQTHGVEDGNRGLRCTCRETTTDPGDGPTLLSSSIAVNSRHRRTGVADTEPPPTT